MSKEDRGWTGRFSHGRLVVTQRYCNHSDNKCWIYTWNRNPETCALPGRTDIQNFGSPFFQEWNRRQVFIFYVEAKVSPPPIYFFVTFIPFLVIKSRGEPASLTLSIVLPAKYEPRRPPSMSILSTFQQTGCWKYPWGRTKRHQKHTKLGLGNHREVLQQSSYRSLFRNQGLDRVTASIDPCIIRATLKCAFQFDLI